VVGVDASGWGRPYDMVEWGALVGTACHGIPGAVTDDALGEGRWHGAVWVVDVPGAAR